MTWRVTASRDDGRGRLRVGRLNLATGSSPDANGLQLWANRWGRGVVVLRAERTATPQPVPPAVLTADGRLRLPADLRAALDVPEQPVVVACDGREVWLLNVTFLAACLP